MTSFVAQRWPGGGGKRHVRGVLNGQSRQRADMIGFAELIGFAIALVLAMEFGRIAKSRGVSAWGWGGLVFVSILFAAVLASWSGQTWAYAAAAAALVGQGPS